MLVKVTGLSKHMGAKELIHELDFAINPREKIALIGRNGHGKSTLLRILSGEDTEFQGQMERKKNLRVVLTRQEHLSNNEMSALEYILDTVPHYRTYEKAIQDYENGVNQDLHTYTEAVGYFSDNGYYYIKDLILETLKDFQLDPDKVHHQLTTLSGGEKRFVELVRVMYSQSDLLLIDEPTNHMDYVGKEQFITWLKDATESIVLVSHDRDVLKYVNKIIEIKDKKLIIFNGNYDHYLKQNTMQTTSSVVEYENQLKRLDEAAKKVEWGNRMRAKSKAWKIRYDHWLRDYEKIKAETVKPSFWIDQDSKDTLDKDVADSYHKYKEKNISINVKESKERISELLSMKNVSLGYEIPLFKDINFSMGNNDRVFIKGRNGAGKSTLVRTILANYHKETPQAKLFEGVIKLGVDLRIGEYEQEINTKYLSLGLGQAIKEAYRIHDLPLEDKNVKRLLAQYLFDPTLDEKQTLDTLSGGQKARFQIIKMLANNPNLLILDEPTNHLDLPSIEELENALQGFQGGILYISHDNYFIKKMGGKVVEI
ncbi:MAG: ATP-binding cassette domain-containing protein [bacterium]|nr:ATP-binding cassette domain-containing protein [bacterium]